MVAGLLSLTHIVLGHVLGLFYRADLAWRALDGALPIRAPRLHVLGQRPNQTPKVEIFERRPSGQKPLGGPHPVSALFPSCVHNLHAPGSIELQLKGTARGAGLDRM